MRLRRTMAAAAATAALVPAALLTATAAFAEDSATTTAGTTTGDSSTGGDTGSTGDTTTSGSTGDTNTGGTTGDSTTGGTTGDTTTGGTTGDTTTGGTTGDTTTGGTTGDTTTGGTTGDTTTGGTTGDTTTGGTTGDTTPPSCPTDGSHALKTSINGLPGEIAAGSGWHKFTLTITNMSDKKVSDITAFAGASRDTDGNKLYKSNKVTIQYYDEDSKRWETIEQGGYTIGFFSAQTLKSGYAVDFPLRVNVRAGAPVGKNVTIGGGAYAAKSGCYDSTSAVKTYKIVASGTDTKGTEPKTGGKAPVPSGTPDPSALKPTGTLAETGSSSALPMIALAGGAAVVVGGGAMFVVRRRKAGAHV